MIAKRTHASMGNVQKDETWASSGCTDIAKKIEAKTAKLKNLFTKRATASGYKLNRPVFIKSPINLLVLCTSTVLELLRMI